MHADSFYDDDGYEDESPTDLIPCSICGRNFNPDSLTRHQNVCSTMKRRKPFDSKKQRMEGLEKPKVTTSQPAVQKIPKKKNWRRQHDEFIKTIRAARGVTTALKTGGELPPPPEPTINPDYIQCQYCNRRFNESAAERHINFCKEQKSRLPKSSADQKHDLKKEKQAKRTQYRPPLPGQKKKTSTESPAKPRSGIGSTNARSPATRPDNSPGMSRKTNSKTKMNRTQEQERPLPTTNSRYNKHDYGSPEPEQAPRTKSGKMKANGDPDWLTDLKRGNSGKNNNRSHGLDATDSGVGLNEHFEKQYSPKSRGRQHPVGVVRPSSRTRDDDLFGDTTKERSPASAGRRQKLANFCHDCGTKYPVPTAKFCCECGMKRAVVS